MGKGHKPGAYGFDLRGLTVKHAAAINECATHGYGQKTGVLRPAGWYIWVKFIRGGGFKWER